MSDRGGYGPRPPNGRPPQRPPQARPPQQAYGAPPPRGPAPGPRPGPGPGPRPQQRPPQQAGYAQRPQPGRPAASPHGLRPPSRSGYVYVPRSAESVRARAERQGGRFDSIFKSGIRAWKPKVGSNVIRFLPPTWEGYDHFAITAYVHGYIGPEQGSYLCIDKHLGKPCPICRAAHEARQHGDEDDARKLQWSERYIPWLLDRDGEDPTKPLPWAMSWTMDRDIAAITWDRRSGETLWIDHPDEGFDISFERVGNNMKNTRYFGFKVDRYQSPIAQDPRVQDQIMAEIMANPIPSILQFYPAEYLQKALYGAPGDATDAGGPRGHALLGDPQETYEEGVQYQETDGGYATGGGYEAPYEAPYEETYEQGYTEPGGYEAPYEEPAPYDEGAAIYEQTTGEAYYPEDEPELPPEEPPPRAYRPPQQAAPVSTPREPMRRPPPPQQLPPVRQQREPLLRRSESPPPSRRPIR